MITTWVSRTRNTTQPIRFSHRLPDERDLVGMISQEVLEEPEFHQAPGTPLRASELIEIATMMRETAPPG